MCSLKRSSFRNCATGISWPIDEKRVEALSLGPARHFGVKAFARFDQRREHLERPASRRGFDLLDDRGQALFFHRQIAVRAKLRSRFGEEQPEKMINFGHGRDGRFAAAARDALLDRHARRQAFDQIDIRLFQLFDELPRVGRHAVEKTALAFRKKKIERERRFSRTAQAGDDDHLVARDLERDVLEIMLARAVDRDGVIAALRSETRCSLARLAQCRSLSSCSASEVTSSNPFGSMRGPARPLGITAFAALRGFRTPRRNRPVCDSATLAISSGVPVATIFPPSSPPRARDR